MNIRYPRTGDPVVDLYKVDRRVLAEAQLLLQRISDVLGIEDARIAVGAISRVLERFPERVKDDLPGQKELPLESAGTAAPF